MSTLSLRQTRTVLIALCLPLIGLPAAAASVTPDDQARIEQEAVDAYLARTARLNDAASDGRIKEFADDLLKDPRSGVIGNPNGDVTIIEFFDYNCPYSRAVEPRVEALLKADPGVRLILKEFTIEDAETSPIAARAALASIQQGKYEAYHQAMMAGPFHTLTAAEIIADARKVGLDVDRLQSDMAAPQAYDQLIANLNLARALRIFQTPTFIINGHMVTLASASIDFPKLVAQARAK